VNYQAVLLKFCLLICFCEASMQKITSQLIENGKFKATIALIRAANKRKNGKKVEINITSGLPFYNNLTCDISCAPLAMIDQNELAQKEFKMQFLKNVRDLEDVLKTCFVKILLLQIKKKKLEIAEKYIKDRKKDLELYKVRAAHGKASADEMSGYEAQVSAIENLYLKLQSDIKCLELELNMFGVANFENTNIFDEVLASINASANECGTEMLYNSQSIEYKKHEKAVKKKSLFKTSVALGSKGLQFNIGLNLSPYHLADISASDHDIEAALEQYSNSVIEFTTAIEARKINIAFIRQRAEVEQKVVDAHTKSLDGAISRYNQGFIDYEKIADRREALYDAMDRQFKLQEEYAETLLDFLKTSGALRVLIVEALNEKEIYDESDDDEESADDTTCTTH
jgi:hypothetical protein